MIARNPFDEPPTLFSAMLTPHRSLNRVGFLVLMAFLSVVSFAAGVTFLMLGAWPVFGFFGLDVLAVYIAFRVNFSRATAREEISVTPTTLVVRRISYRGSVSEWSFNPLWVTLDQRVHEAYGIERLALVSRGRALPIASFLGASEKASFAKALASALAAAKRGVDYNPIRTDEV
jgi:uncharacterized membrane protein